MRKAFGFQKLGSSLNRGCFRTCFNNLGKSFLLKFSIPLYSIDKVWYQICSPLILVQDLDQDAFASSSMETKELYPQELNRKERTTIAKAKDILLVKKYFITETLLRSIVFCLQKKFFILSVSMRQGIVQTVSSLTKGLSGISPR